MDYAYTLIGSGVVSVIESKQMHNKVEVHRDTLKAMLENSNLMAERESLIVIVMSRMEKFMRVHWKRIGRQMLQKLAQHKLPSY